MRDHPDPKHEHVWIAVEDGSVCAGPHCDVTLSATEATYLSQTKEKES